MKIALIGLGMVADTHVAAIQASEKGLELVGVLGRDQARAADFATKRGLRNYRDVTAIADDPEVDFVILATPPDARLTLASALVAAQKPVLREKPIERDLKAANALVDIFEVAHVPLGIMLQHRAREASIAMKQAIDAGVLGEVATVDVRVPWWRDQGYYDAPGRGTYGRDGGGVMISQAIHTLDLAIWILGPIDYVQAMMRQTPLHRLEAEDWAGALLEFQNGAIGTLMATTAAFPGTAESITVQGTKATAHLASGVLTLTHFDGRSETIGAVAATGGGADPMAFTHAWHQSVIEDFAASLTNGTLPLATGRSALAAHELHNDSNLRGPRA
jgi:UDP-N-acetyl-2-amino-2-deoxyglucuronate dehydrogenase